MRLDRMLCLGTAVALLACHAPARAASGDATGRVEQAGRVGFDLLILRPLDVATTAIGLAAALVAYPVALPFGGEDHVVDYLVKKPVYRSFQRPLGEL
jgi:hypothetical protein